MASIEFLKSSTTLISSGGVLNNDNWHDYENNVQVNHDIIIILISYCLFLDRCQRFILHGVEMHLLARW